MSQHDAEVASEVVDNTPTRHTTNLRAGRTALRAGAVASVAVAATLGTGGGTPTAAAGPEVPVGLSDGGPHCVLSITGQSPDGTYLLDQPVCYPTLEEALEDSGPPADGDAGRAARSSVSASSVTLATHFAALGLTGASISISGTTCGGGHVNLSSSWVNRVSSTLNNCPTVVFFAGVDKGGASEVTAAGSHNLGALNDLSQSVSYGS